jgi:hypothetical protein
MSSALQGWESELIQAFPDIFHPKNEPSARAFPECGAGWRELLERACVRIRMAVSSDRGSFQATQIKEKFGTLRFYWEGRLSPKAEAQVHAAIELAEARSACTCEICGEEGQLYRQGGWLTTRCTAHAQGSLVQINPRLANVQVLERIVSKRKKVSARRYDRVTDSFVEVDPRSLNLEE